MRAHVAGLMPDDRPLHVLDVAGTRPRARDGVTFHRWSAPLLPRHLLVADDDVLCLGPEALMMELGRHLDDTSLLMLGFELCGTYRIDPAYEAGFARCEPLATPGSVQRALDECSGAHGTARLRHVLPHLTGGSASPMETALALLAGLPRRDGGLGAPKPLLNHRIDPGRRWRSSADRGHYACDLYWPDRRVALEYDSDLFHTGGERISGDARRRGALQAMGVTVLTATRGQLYRRRDFLRLMEALRRALRLRSRASGRDHVERQERLRRLVLGLDQDPDSLPWIVRHGERPAIAHEVVADVRPRPQSLVDK